MKDLKRMNKLIKILNEGREKYYNNGNSSPLSDYEYDRLFDELSELEKATGIILSNSPTQEVGYTVQDKLEKSVHEIPMLSLDKTKKSQELLDFIGNKDAILMLKMDGNTCAITYESPSPGENAVLVKAETRGNGEVGSNITMNAKTFINIPQTIPYKGKLIVFGESIIDYPTFYKINNELSEENKYKNPRNLCAASVQLLDTKVCAERGIRFVAWRLALGSKNDSFSGRLEDLREYGFEVVDYVEMPHNLSELEIVLESQKEKANQNGLPIDGMVASYNSVSLIDALGATTHHMRGQLAYKYGEDKEFTTIREIEWSASKNSLNPVAIFDPVELAGTTVSRASLSNLQIMKELNIKIGAAAEVCKRNEIIPHIESCDGIGKDVVIPDRCPICNSPTEVINDTLICTNPNCKGKLLGKLTHAVSRNALNIDGLSEATIETLINRGWLNNIKDIYNLSEYKKEMTAIPGLGAKSVNKLLEAIEKSRNTTLDRFLYSLSVPLLGKSASKDISRFCENDESVFIELMGSNPMVFKQIDGVGDKLIENLEDWWYQSSEFLFDLLGEFHFEKETEKDASNSVISLNGASFCITGKVVYFGNRDAFVAAVEAHGGKYLSGVSAKLDWLVNNDVTSTSGKNKKMHELGKADHIISEEQFLKMIGE